MLAPAALGALEPKEHAELVAHLRTCASCRAALGRLMSAAEALPIAVEEREPSSELRERLRAKVGASAKPAGPVEPLGAPANDAPIPLSYEPIEEPRERVSRMPGRVTWLMAAAALLLLGVIGGVVLDRTVFSDAPPDNVREIALSSPSGLELSGARLVYLEEEGIVRFEGASLPEPPEGQVYQAWLIGDAESLPTPAGVVDPETGELAMAADPERYSTFAVTMEPGPLGSAEPTSDPVIVGELAETSTS